MTITSYSLKGRLRRPFARPSGVGGIIVYGTDIQTDTHMGQTYRQTHTHMGQTYRQTHLWDRHTDRHIWPVKNSFYARNFFVCAPIPGLGFFQTPRTHGESVHVLRFKIGPKTKAGGRIEHSNGQLSL